MSHHEYDDYNYGLVYKKQFADIKANGFDETFPSTDGNWQIIDKGDKSRFDWIDFDINLLPDYMKELGVDKCCLSYKETIKILSCIASTKGASDGYRAPNGGV